MSEPKAGATCDVPGGKIWYEILNPDASGLPVVTVHGGPGTPHDYLRSTADLLSGRPVVVYDQLGCGRSERPSDLDLWRLERFVDELEALISHLGLERFHLFGHSFGAMIACDFALRGPARLRTLILGSPVLSVRKYENDMRQLLTWMRPESARALTQGMRTGQYNTPEFVEAAMCFAEEHSCRVEPWPDDLMESTVNIAADVRDAMWGSTEFEVTGNLKSYERVDRLAELDVPVLIVSGEHDYVPSRACQAYARAMPDAAAVVVAGASHMPHLEAPTLFAKEVRARLDEHRS
ncbi:MAG: proline iminopeptidase-family hydrolase [Stackebrandtia sp.]